jgi:twitching motility protein PilT
MSMISELLAYAVASGASDIHIKPGQSPHIRVGGMLIPSGFETLSTETLVAIAHELVPPHLQAQFASDHEVDFSHREPHIGRFRVSVFHGEGVPALAIRHVKADIPSVEALNLPPELHRLADLPSGLVVLSGTTGCGKSTTLAAVVEEINNKHERRIITVEDPVEFAFTDKRSVITQREVGLDSPSFMSALRHVLRQDPDVILIGEMRDVETVRVAVLAAETGHLVFTTLHAGTAAVAVPRLLDLFPANEQAQIRMALSANLRAIVCQRLIPSASGSVVPAVELLFNTPTVSKLLAKNQLHVLTAAMESGREDGMQTFNQALYELIRSGRVTEKEGLRQATNPESLEMNLKGIFLDEGRKILAAL